MIYSLPIPSRFMEDSSAPPPLPANVDAAVEKIWQERRALSPSLFNGRIYVVGKVSADEVMAQLTEYRLFVAQWHEPSLYTVTKIDTLSVAGVVRTAEGVVWGQRSAGSTQYPNIWELIPSGGVDLHSRVESGDLKPELQLLEELEGELGLKEADVFHARPVGFLHDTDRHIYHLCTEIETRLSFDEIQRRHGALPSKEHEELRLVRFAQLELFLGDEGRDLADFSRALLDRCGLL